MIPTDPNAGVFRSSADDHAPPDPADRPTCDEVPDVECSACAGCFKPDGSRCRAFPLEKMGRRA